MSRCSSAILIMKNKHQKPITYIVFIPDIDTVTHIRYKYRYTSCGINIDINQNITCCV